MIHRVSPRLLARARAGAALAAATLGCALALAACTPSDAGPAPAVTALAQVPPAPATVLGATDPAELAVRTSETFFAHAPVVVAAPTGAPAEELAAASLGAALGVPVLLAGPGAPTDPVAAELARLGTTTVLAVGDVTGPETTTDAGGTDPSSAPGMPEVVRVPADPARLGELLALELGQADPVADGEQVAALAALDPEAPVVLTLEGSAPSPPDAGAAVASPTGGTDGSSSGEGPTLPLLAATARVDGVAALSDGAASQAAAVGTALAAGAEVLAVPSGDPRSSAEAIGALAARPAEQVVGLGPAFGDAEELAWRTATAATGVLLPSGTQLVFGETMYVALYGTPGSGALGVLGEQGVPETVARAQRQAAAFEPYTDERVVPSVEIIASIASGGAGPDGNYSAERPVSELRPLVDAAQQAGMAVVLDLQPGRTDFLTQARLYEELLLEPNVGLALDPEWRLEPDQVHLRQIGSVGVDEVNEVVAYLADLTRDNRLPQKLMILHQFRLSMIEGRERLDTSRSELAMMIHVDGQGTQPAKQETWRALRADPPDVRWGWKNFHDEDVPMLTPQQTMGIDPVPDLVSYQ